MKFVRLLWRSGFGRAQVPVWNPAVTHAPQKLEIRTAGALSVDISLNMRGDIDTHVHEVTTPDVTAWDSEGRQGSMTGDPILDHVLRDRRLAGLRLRELRAKLMHERLRLADITAFLRSRSAPTGSRDR